jgi:cysteine desulfurase
MGLISAHKFGGPKGVGAVLLRRGLDLPARIKGGGQEMGRRSGTENIIGIAGLAAALKAVDEELSAGVWEKIAEFRNILEIGLHSAANKTIFVGKGAHRLPNTSCILTPGWKGETQVMQMDLAGFAISAGSACSSGKVRASRVLQAMGYDDVAASSAIRVSLGPKTTKDEINRFADAWLKQHEKFRARAA